jgi:DNA-binding CsgD family transcriptional regulator
MAVGRGRPGVGLRGRVEECGVLDRLLDGVRAGQGQVLVVRGEAGMGKTALLDHLVGQASDVQVMRAAGMEAEGELAFAGLHLLFGAHLGDVEGLPGPQRAALRRVFGMDGGDPPDRFLVGLAVLGLLAALAEERPLVCVVDDVQWLDRSSLQALGFAARRLLAEPLALVFAVREPSDERELAGLPELLVGGLGDADAGALLDSVAPGRMDEQVRARIIAETRGNPLALLELPRGMTGAELPGRFGRLDARPLASRIEQSYLRRIRSLPAPTRTLLLLAAAEPVGDVVLLWSAAERLGVDPGAAAPAEDAGLVEIGARVRFGHPLARAAAYRAADVTERRRAHQALAEATDPAAEPDRRAWHRALATVGPDDEVAAELERSAARAQARGGVAAAAASLARATELTADPALRGVRALVAAEAKLGAASPEDASSLIATASLCPLDELDQARVARLRAQVAYARRRGSDAPPLLFEAAQRLEPLDGALARETYLDALGAALFAGRLSDPGVVEVARAARSAPPGPQPPRMVDLLLDGLATRYAEGYVAGVEPLRRALRAARDDDEVRWLWLASRVAAELWDDEACHELVARHVRLAREAGALAALPLALGYRAITELLAGEFTHAEASMQEVAALTVAGEAPMMYGTALLMAWRGEKERLTMFLDVHLPALRERGEGRGLTSGDYLRAVLGNGLGDYEAALTSAQAACEHDDLDIYAWALVELVEAAARCGRPGDAAGALERLGERTQACATHLALGIEARSRALLSHGDEADGLYREAVERLARTRVAVHHARARLVYGEWLRREGRRVDAREQLRAAHDMFDRFGARGFAERARRELSATGETVRKRSTPDDAALTPQESQVARLASEGHTNSEIGAQLFISPRTAEYHLSKVFTKLGIGSRRELRGALAPEGVG